MTTDRPCVYCADTTCDNSGKVAKRACVMFLDVTNRAHWLDATPYERALLVEANSDRMAVA